MQARIMEHRIREAQRVGNLVVVTGDLNFPLVPAGAAPSHSPQAVFERCGPAEAARASRVA